MEFFCGDIFFFQTLLSSFHDSVTEKSIRSSYRCENLEFTECLSLRFQELKPHRNTSLSLLIR